MIRFRTLGGLDLRDDSGHEFLSILRQPKRLALLAYLAIATPAGYHRRDTILALLWPEMDGDRARSALRQAVHFLRRTLGADIVQGHGGEDLGIVSDEFWCDARAFDDALARGEAAEALELYGGDVLHGFFVTGASNEFDEWLAQQRARRRQQAIESAWALADRCEATGSGTDAVRWSRWAAERAPDDERSHRRLIALLDRLGDRTGALRAYENFVQRARDEFDAEPSAETQALVAAIRARTTPSVTVPDAPAAMPARIVAPPARPSDDIAAAPELPVVSVSVAARPRPFWSLRRARTWLATAGALLVTAGAVYGARAVRSGEQPPDAAAGTVDDAFGSVRQSRAPHEIVTTSSPVAARFFAAGLRALYDHGDARLARSLFLDALGEDTSLAMAAYYAAQCAYDLGSPEGPSLMVRARRLAPRASERERLIIETAWASGTYDPNRMEIAESLATRYPMEPEGHIALATTLVAAGDFLGAVPHLRHVIDMDSSAVITAQPLCSACVAFDDLVQAYIMADSLGEAERVAREWVRRQPRSAAAWVAFVGVIARTPREREADEAERQAAALDPSADAAVAMAIIAVHADDYLEADRMLSARLQSAGPEAASTVRWWQVIAFRNEGHLGEALAAARALATPEMSQRELGGDAEAQVLFEEGHYRSAARIFDSLAAIPPTAAPNAPGSLARQRSWMLTHAATAWAAAGDTVHLAQLADSVEGSARLSSYGRDWSLPHYLRGLLWRARGDSARSLRELSHAIFSPSEGYTRANLELAREWLGAGQPRAAVAILSSALRGPVEASSFYLTRTEIHELLARSFEAAGLPDSAAAHYAIVARSWHNGDPPFRRRAAIADAARRRLTHARA
ncbi:MAG TPA: BTAD domain-containing putative transcriptional regulator [Gemmatimonadaceae bacterium]|nr:BTAD domain-containing putative transcriptional regulator [Gemmatimonadaceae bacterium]